MSHEHITNKHQGWSPDPKTPTQWLEHWTKAKLIYAPTRRGFLRSIQLRDVAIPKPGTDGNPDLLMTMIDGKQFYVMFDQGQRVFKALNKPVLVVSPEKGESQAWWLMR